MTLKKNCAEWNRKLTKCKVNRCDQYDARQRLKRLVNFIHFFFSLKFRKDNFREDQANEYTTLKKDLEITTKNCRILSFKLKKSERKIEQLEVEKQSSAPAALISQIKQLEEELKISNDRLQQMQVCTPCNHVDLLF